MAHAWQTYGFVVQEQNMAVGTQENDEKWQQLMMVVQVRKAMGMPAEAMAPLLPEY